MRGVLSHCVSVGELFMSEYVIKHINISEYKEIKNPHTYFI